MSTADAALADACPICPPGIPDASLPLGAPEAVPGGAITAHQCGTCEAAWNTFWRDGWPIERTLAPVAAERAERNRAALEAAMKQPRSAA